MPPKCRVFWFMEKKVNYTCVKMHPSFSIYILQIWRFLYSHENTQISECSSFKWISGKISIPMLRQAKDPTLGNRECPVVESHHYHLIITSADSDQYSIETICIISFLLIHALKQVFIISDKYTDF